VSTSRQLRAVRGVIAATSATFLALMSHLLGGGQLPGWLGIVVPWVLSLPVCAMLAGRRLSLWRLSLSVVLSQVLFHVLFVLGTPAGSPLSSAQSGAHHHGPPPLPPQLPLHPVSAQTLDAVGGDAAMWLSHLVAAGLTILFLYRGERAIQRLQVLAKRLAAWVRRRLLAPPHVPAPMVCLPQQPSLSEVPSVLSQLHGSTLTRRGPPCVSGIAR